MILPRCANPEINDYPPWLLSATRRALLEIMDGANLEDARFVLQSIDAALVVMDTLSVTSEDRG